MSLRFLCFVARLGFGDGVFIWGFSVVFVKRFRSKDREVTFFELLVVEYELAFFR